MIPIRILEKLAAAGKISKRSLLIGNQLRARRMAPIPVPHIDGETRNIHDAQNMTHIPGKEARAEGDPESKDVAVNEAFDALGATYKFYKEVFGRDSIDGKGMLMLGIVHYDKDLDNAYWDSTEMVFGDGQYFNRFTADLSVPGHELTHGVTEHTANLDYQNQPGALNEHISDAFGAMIEQYTYQQTADKAHWLVGELLTQGKIKGRALRDMLNPGTAYDDPIIGKDDQPAHMKNLYTGWQDNGGVHINSGIPNKAFATACIMMGGFSWETIGRVWYDVLVNHCKYDTKFQEFADMTYASAVGPDQQNAIAAGWAAVGITVAQTVPMPDPTPAPVPSDPGSPCITEFLGVLTPEQKVAMRHLLAQVRRAIK